MKLSINNFAKIKQADIIIDGITEKVQLEKCFSHYLTLCRMWKKRLEMNA